MRLFWIDAVRVFAILSVIGIHVSAPVFKHTEVGAATWWIADFINSFSRFGVPLFLMISGSLLLGKEYDTLDFYKKRALRLLFPLVFWTAFYHLGINFLNGRELFRLKDIFFLIINKGGFYHLWYLYVFSLAMLFVPFVNMIIIGKKATSRDYYVLIAIIVIFSILLQSTLILQVVKNIKFNWYISSMTFVGLMLVGYIISKKYDTINFNSKVAIIIVLLLSLIGAILNYTVAVKLNIHKDNFVIIAGGPLSLIISSFIFYAFAKVGGHLRPSKLLSSIADTSFGVYLLHPAIIFLSLKAFPVLKSLGIIEIPILFCITFTISHCTIYCMRRITIFRYIT
ncbi:acyltransferase [Pseudodesulfovibrio cashew]|nr:acyltransferase family protein [Pseudodesulfovibrio cashew]